MSLTSSRVTLTHRLTVQRDQNLDSDNGVGNPLPPDWQYHLTDLPCRAWTDVGRGPRSGNEVVAQSVTLAEVQGRRCTVPLETDITERDRILEITYRDEPLFDGPMNIQAVLTYPDHLELVLQRVR